MTPDEIGALIGGTLAWACIFLSWKIFVDWFWRVKPPNGMDRKQ